MNLFAAFDSWTAVVGGVGIVVASKWVKPENANKGVIWKFFCRYRLGRLCRDDFFWFMVVYNVSIVLFDVGGRLLGIKGLGAFPWSFYVVMCIDDYFNGDDDNWKKKWESAKNKIKWLMDLPTQPEPQVAS